MKTVKCTPRIGRLIAVGIIGAATLAGTLTTTPVMAQGRHRRGRDMGRAITFQGRVTDSRNQENVLRVRTSDGQVYTVHTQYASDFRLHDRVEVSGRVRGSDVYGATVSRLSRRSRR
jgi:hypothetical protein